MVCGRMGCTGSANTHWRFPASSNPTYGRSWAAAPPQQRKIVKSLIMLLVSGRAIRLAATPAVQHRPKCLVSRQQGACVIWLLKRDWAGSGVGFQTRLRPAAFLQNGEWKPCDTPGPHLTAPHRDHDDQCHPSSSRLPPLLQPTGPLLLQPRPFIVVPSRMPSLCATGKASEKASREATVELGRVLPRVERAVPQTGMYT